MTSARYDLPDDIVSGGGVESHEDVRRDVYEQSLATVGSFISCAGVCIRSLYEFTATASTIYEVVFANILFVARLRHQLSESHCRCRKTGLDHTISPATTVPVHEFVYSNLSI